MYRNPLTGLMTIPMMDSSTFEGLGSELGGHVDHG